MTGRQSKQRFWAKPDFFENVHFRAAIKGQSRHQTRLIRAPRLFDFDIATQRQSRNREWMTFGDAILPLVVFSLSNWPCQVRF
jgi:hypothetical protein